MTGTIGGVFVELKATVDDAGVVKAEQRINTSAKKIETSFKAVDSTIARTGRQTERMGNQANAAGGKVGGMGRKAGAASIQFQQFTGQVSGGVNPLIAFSQQAADLGIVLGAPLLGSVVGIAAAIGVILLPELFKSKSAMQELEGIAETLGMSLKKSSTGVNQLSDSIEKLAAVSAPLARLQIASSIQDAEKKIKIAAQGINDSMINLGAGAVKLDTLNRIGGNADDLYKKLQNFHDLPGDLGLNPVQLVDTRIAFEQVAERMGVTTSQAGGLIIALKKVQKESSVSNIAALESTLSRLNDETGGGSEKLIEFAKSFLPFFKAAREGTDELNALRMSFSDLFGQLKKPEEAKALTEADVAAQSLTQQVALATAQIDGGSNAARRLALAFELGVGNASQLSDPIKDALAALEAVEQKQADITTGDKADASNKAVLDKKITALRESFKTEAVLRDEAFALDIEAIRAFGLTSEAAKAEADALELARVQAHADALVAVAADKTSREQALEKRKSSLIISMNMATASAAMGLLDEMANGSKAAAIAAVALNKGMAIAQAIQNTGVAVMAAQAVDPTGVLATRAKLMGKAQVAMIAATGLMQAGRAGGASTTGFSGGVPAVNTRQQAQGGGGTQNINISGIDRNSLISGGQVVALLNEALGDGVTINFAGG